MSVWETVNVSLDDLYHQRDWEDLKCTVRRGKGFMHGSYFEPLSKAANVDSNLNSYFSTELSHLEDAIQAMSGIFSRYNKVGGGSAILVLSGLPLYISVVAGSQIYPTSYLLDHTLLKALGWSFRNFPLLKRREVFPSWTWAGWQEVDGSSRMSQAGYVAHVTGGFVLPYNFHIPCDTEVQAGILSHGRFPHILWKKVHELPWQQHDGQIQAHFIGLKGWTFTLTVSVKGADVSSGAQGPGVDDFTVVFPDISMFEPPSVHINHGAPGLEDGIELVAMPLGITPYYQQGKAVSVIILLLCPTCKEIDSKIIYERVGLAICRPRKRATIVSKKARFGKQLINIFRRPDPFTTRDDWQVPSWARGVFQTVYIG